jgi:hypothetical protein
MRSRQALFRLDKKEPEWIVNGLATDAFSALEEPEAHEIPVCQGMGDGVLGNPHHAVWIRIPLRIRTRVSVLQT